MSDRSGTGSERVTRNALESLERLRQGNLRFVAAEGTRDLAVEHARRQELVRDQAPFAIVLGCSDSRVPAEIVFDQGLGDLFVIRVAGNIVAPSQVGSIEFAAERFSVRLVVVLGHSQCGAVMAAVESTRRPSSNGSPNLGFIVDRILPGVEPLVKKAVEQDPAQLLENAVKANISASCQQLRQGSEILERLIAESGLLVVGAEYSLESGRVEFFDGVPPGR